MMPQNDSLVAENGRMSNGNAGFKIPKRTYSEMNAGSDGSVDYKTFEAPVPQDAAPPATNIVSVPVYNHGFVHSQPETPAAKIDYFKFMEPKREPSKTPDEPLKDLTPMQQELEMILPGTANLATLPAKLSEKFSLSTCELCKVNMLSIIQSKMHYNGKPHLKKVRMFLINECGKTDEPSSKIAKVANPESDLKNEENRECKVCKVIFNSSIHAKQHYEGKKHKKALVNQAKSGAITDPRFGIGTGFASASTAQPSNNTPSISKPFFCELCNVQGSSSEQFKTHMEGARHAKNLRKINGTDVSIPVPNYDDGSEAFAMFRTPSGKFYCHYCNYNGKTRKKFASHVQTDNHGINAKKYKQTHPKAEIIGFDLTEDEYVSKYEDY